MYVLVYGTLRKGEGNHGVMCGAEGEYVDTVTIQGFTMYTLHGYFPGVQVSNDPTDRIVCEIYRVPDKRITVIDALEGYDPARPHGNLYNRIKAKVGDKEAWIYLYAGDLYGNKIEDWKNHD